MRPPVVLLVLPAIAPAQSAAPGATAAEVADPPLTRAAEVPVPGSLNVFRRFSADGPKTLAFGGEVLGQ